MVAKPGVEPLLRLGVTVRPPDTALSSVTVKVIESPSSALASSIVTAAKSPSSFVMVPFAVSVAPTAACVPETARLTMKLSLRSASVSSIVATVKVCVSPAVPVKLSAAVFSV